jgi:hypothetical protein
VFGNDDGYLDILIRGRLWYAIEVPSSSVLLARFEIVISVTKMYREKKADTFL